MTRRTYRNLLDKVKETSAKILYVSNPNNPMGTINKPSDIETLITESSRDHLVMFR